MYEYIFFDLKVYFLILILKKLKPSTRPSEHPGSQVLFLSSLWSSLPGLNLHGAGPPMPSATGSWGLALPT